MFLQLSAFITSYNDKYPRPRPSSWKGSSAYFIQISEATVRTEENLLSKFLAIWAWFANWHYDEAHDLAYRHTCLKAFELKKMKSNRADPAFVS